MEIEINNPMYRLIGARHGYFLANPRDFYIGRALIEYGEFSELEWELLAQVTPKNGFVVEIGANIGAHTVSMAKKVGKKGGVIAFEPQPVIFQNLCANLALNGLTNVHAVNAGCSDVADEIVMPRIDYTREGNFGAISLENLPADTGAWAQVRITTLDDFSALTALHLIKIDAEGMETKILKGASSTIDRFRPVIYLENRWKDRSRELIETVFDFGYDAWWHMPRLFNTNNYFAKDENIYKNTLSVNMLCLPREAKINVKALNRVQNEHDHPLS